MNEASVSHGRRGADRGRGVHHRRCRTADPSGQQGPKDVLGRIRGQATRKDRITNHEHTNAQQVPL
eukprot:8506963-Alexandrium_andersonii.AAC.1